MTHILRSYQDDEWIITEKTINTTTDYLDIVYKQSTYFVKELKEIYQQLDCSQYFHINDNNPYDINIDLQEQHHITIEQWLSNNEWYIHQLIYSLVRPLGFYMNEAQRNDDIKEYNDELYQKRLWDSQGIEWWLSWYHTIADNSMEQKLKDIYNRPLIDVRIIEKIEQAIVSYLMDNGYDLDWKMRTEECPEDIFITTLTVKIFEPLVKNMIDKTYIGWYTLNDDLITVLKNPA